MGAHNNKGWCRRGLSLPAVTACECHIKLPTIARKAGVEGQEGLEESPTVPGFKGSQYQDPGGRGRGRRAPQRREPELHFGALPDA